MSEIRKYPGPYIYVAPSLFKLLKKLGWDMQFYRINKKIPIK